MPVLLDILAAIYATCFCFFAFLCSVHISGSPIMISAFKKSTFLNTNY